MNKYVWQGYNDFWITKEGTVYELQEMTTSHIENCIAMMDCADVDKRTVPIYRKLKQELARRECMIWITAHYMDCLQCRQFDKCSGFFIERVKWVI